MKIRNTEFEIGSRTFIMGILNVTPDSFSDGGKFNNVEFALRQTEKMIEDGCDIIDIGGESTRPGFKPVSPEEELTRVIPVIEAIYHNFDIPISIDTSKAAVAKEALYKGASLVNDIWGFKLDSEMAYVAAEHDAVCCLMHNRKEAVYENFIQDVIDDLNESIQIALHAGVKRSNLIIDPGVGFAKSYEQNLDILRNLDKLKCFDLPILLGTSRKSVIGNTLELPVDKRVEGTVATSVIGISKGCDFVRVHDIVENVRACKMADKILRFQ